MKPEVVEVKSSARESALTASVKVGTTTHVKDGYTLTFINKDPILNSDTKDKMISYFFVVYPKEANRFYSGASKKVTFIVDPGYTGAAATGGTNVTFSAEYMASNPQDIDVVTHESMHVVQGYPGYASAKFPAWLVEGIADYARYKYGVTNTGWSLTPYANGQKYTDSYRISANFLLWCEKNVKASIVDNLDDALRNGKFDNDKTWEKLTGKTVEELWKSYKAPDDRLTSGQMLTTGEYLISPNGVYKLIMQSDGNLVLYKKGTTTALWHTNTFGKPVVKCAMQADGNLVLYDKNNKAFWNTVTYMYPGGFFVVQNDGNLVVYQKSIARWHRW